MKNIFLLLILFSFSACDEACIPGCQTGFTCVSATCVTVCNPECESGFTCNATTSECDEDVAEESALIRPDGIDFLNVDE